jgi:glucose/mannose-6-phosphate isomerase
MYKIYDKWPEIAKNSYQIDHEPLDLDIKHIVFVGMGGSGVVGDIFQSILSKTKIHVNVVRGYNLPTTVDENTLLIAASISGNTQETLFVIDSAKKSGCKIIACSSGGRLQDYCLKNNLEFRKIKEYHSPRASLPAFVYSLSKILKNTLQLKEDDIVDSINQLELLSKKISSTNLVDENPSLELAKWISGIPLIYYPSGLRASALRFKNCLHENAKIHAIAEEVLEATHNNIVAWEKTSEVKPILLQGADDHPKTKERWKILKEYFESNKINYKEIYSIQGSILSKIMHLIYLFDYTTIYYAALSKIDPSPISSLDFVKKRLDWSKF